MARPQRLLPGHGSQVAGNFADPEGRPACGTRAQSAQLVTVRCATVSRIDSLASSRAPLRAVRGRRARPACRLGVVPATATAIRPFHAVCCHRAAIPSPARPGPGMWLLPGGSPVRSGLGQAL